jgi:hypothetical protein
MEPTTTLGTFDKNEEKSFVQVDAQVYELVELASIDGKTYAIPPQLPSSIHKGTAIAVLLLDAGHAVFLGCVSSE